MTKYFVIFHKEGEIDKLQVQITPTANPFGGVKRAVENNFRIVAAGICDINSGCIFYGSLVRFPKATREQLEQGLQNSAKLLSEKFKVSSFWFSNSDSLQHAQTDCEIISSIL